MTHKKEGYQRQNKTAFVADVLLSAENLTDL